MHLDEPNVPLQTWYVSLEFPRLLVPLKSFDQSYHFRYYNYTITNVRSNSRLFLCLGQSLVGSLDFLFLAVISKCAEKNLPDCTVASLTTGHVGDQRTGRRGQKRHACLAR